MYLSGSVILRQEVWRQKPGLKNQVKRAKARKEDGAILPANSFAGGIASNFNER